MKQRVLHKVLLALGAITMVAAVVGAPDKW